MCSLAHRGHTRRLGSRSMWTAASTHGEGRSVARNVSLQGVPRAGSLATRSRMLMVAHVCGPGIHLPLPSAEQRRLGVAPQAPCRPSAASAPLSYVSEGPCHPSADPHMSRASMASFGGRSCSAAWRVCHWDHSRGEGSGGSHLPDLGSHAPCAGWRVSMFRGAACALCARCCPHDSYRRVGRRKVRVRPCLEPPCVRECAPPPSRGHRHGPTARN